MTARIIQEHEDGSSTIFIDEGEILEIKGPSIIQLDLRKLTEERIKNARELPRWNPKGAKK